ncbi:MAG: fumarylacetoacetate hydrolase family protein [Proteobacteria bacterium]|nr:fumarylacetoacetate hydrolase family protein [Pseudomonadota bacterium]MDA1238204.1 fumarylacetoacetate hydrolase family protein [Pseudomonadota bacterium]
MPKVITFTVDNKQSFGVLSDEGVIDMGGVYNQHSNLTEVIAAGLLEDLVAASSGRTTDFKYSNFLYDIPIPNPEKIICIGVNFPDRNAEYKDGQDAPTNPSLFVRFPGSFTGHNKEIIRPPESYMLDYEGEIAIVIGLGGRRIQEVNAYKHIAALTLCNEGTLRDWLRHAKFNVTQGKNFDSSGSMGPWIVPFRDALQLDDINLETRVNGEVRQKDRTSRMIFSFRKIIAYVSTFTTLVPGDVLVCGTPTGAGARFDPPIWLIPGDLVEVEAEGIGTLSNHIADEVVNVESH